MKSVKTYWANIYVGLRRGYNGDQHHRREAKDWCQKYCDEVGLCVTVTPTHFIYKDGKEHGVIIGIINYPRFPSTKAEIKRHALEIATILGKKFMQSRVSIVMPNETIMLVSNQIEGGQS